jgi:hypothetical protein
VLIGNGQGFWVSKLTPPPKTLMSMPKWFEKKLFAGDALKDYGDLQDELHGFTGVRASIPLCRRKGKLKLVFRNANTTAPFDCVGL